MGFGDALFEPLGMDSSSAAAVGDVTSEPEGSDLIFHSGSTLSYICDNIVFNVSGERVYLIMMSPCFTEATQKVVEVCKEYLCPTI